MVGKSHTGTSERVSVSDNNSLKIKAKDLRSNNVYKGWFVNIKPKKQETGAGTPPYMFETDSNGNGTYESRLRGILIRLPSF
jgi:hypothetical protein